MPKSVTERSDQSDSHRSKPRKPGFGIKRLEMLQIGDVHYPEAVSESLGDVKDRVFPPGVREATTITPMQCVLRAAMREADQRKLHSVLFCGDLTSFGRAEEYRKCVEHFHKALNLATYDSRRIHAVPGNHDVDRTLVKPTEMFEKFIPFQRAWEDVGLSVLAVRAPRITDVALAICEHASC